MNLFSDTTHRRLGIAFRTALLSWLVALGTLLIFLGFVIPQQKRTFLENLESKSRGVSASLQEITAGAIVNEAYDSVVEHCLQVLRDDPSIGYLVISKSDGFSLICESVDPVATNSPTGRTAPIWRSDNLGDYWRPQLRVARGGIETVPALGRRVFHYSRPFDYSGIEWGWIHVGLSLKSFDASVQRAYTRLSLLSLVCVAFSLLASLAYASRLVKPLLALQSAVQRLARGELSARATVQTGDEVGDLARSVNLMADALLQRNRILESVRFAAKGFLSTSSWSEVIERVLARLGEASQASRAYLFENHRAADGSLVASYRHEWIAPGIPSELGRVELQAVSWKDAGLGHWAESFQAGQIATVHRRELGPAEHAIISPSVQSLIVLPVKVQDEWWGVLGFDQCDREREWSEADKDSYRALADMLGAAIERKRAQDALLVAKEKAEAASHAKSQFLANMSHEIRTPITGVMGMLHLLKRTQTGPKQLRYISQALDSADSLLGVIGDVLDFSKIEAGRLELEASDFSLHEVVDSAVHLFAGRAEQKRLELVGRMDPRLPDGFCSDANRLRQILVNLVGNAIKFTERGEVVLSCSLLELQPDRAVVRFEVRDTGCGIAPEHQKLIFEAFSQADNSMARVHGGTGLGLTISRQLCELLGGTIAVESEPGRGSRFWFTADLKLASEANSEATRRARDLRGLSVLVVDDSAVMREVVRELVQTWRGEPADVCDAESALEELRAAARRGRPFAVAVLDWMMPGQDGLALAERIKADVALKDTGLVLLTSFAQALKNEDLGHFAAHVAKPVRCSELYDAITAAANGRLTVSLGSSVVQLQESNFHAVPGAGPQVLIAEDNEINREVITELLAHLGYSWRCVVNGREAIESVKTGEAGLVLMDCQMPEVDGYQAARSIRSWETTLGNGAHVPIIALTAHTMSGDRERCLEAGMDDYLTKPIDPDQLETVLLRWFGAHAAPPKPKAPEISSAASSAPVASLILDYEALLCRCLGKPALAQRLVAKLAEQGRQDEKEMRLAIVVADADRVALAAHRLKGASANVAANRLRELAAQLEAAARTQQLAPVAALLNQLEIQLAALEAQARQHWPQPASP